jgi:hypothetical protein
MLEDIDDMPLEAWILVYPTGLGNLCLGASQTQAKLENIPGARLWSIPQRIRGKMSVRITAFPA